MQQLAEEDAQRGQQRPQHDDTHKIQWRCIGPGLQHKGLGRMAHLPADKDAQQRREQAGEQCGVLHRADIHDLKRKDGGSQRRAEDGRERTRHAAHRHQAAVVVFQMQRLADLPGHTAAQQQRRALAAAGTAEQMGHDGGGEDQRCCAQGQGLMLPHGHKDLIGRAAAVRVKMLVQKYDDKARRRQQIQQPRLCGADGVGPVQSQPERRPQRPHNTADQRGQRQPFGTDKQIPGGTAKMTLDPFHKPSRKKKNLKLL